MMDVSVYLRMIFHFYYLLKKMYENPLPCKYILQYDIDRHIIPFILSLLLIHILKLISIDEVSIWLLQLLIGFKSLFMKNKN